MSSLEIPVIVMAQAMPPQTLKRFNDWPERLDTFIKQRMDRPFQYGKNDCCTFAADAVLAMTGSDLAAEFRGSYKTQLEAEKVIAQFYSVFALMGRVAEKWSMKSVPGKFAARGDIALVPTPVLSLGVVGLCGDRVWVVAGKGLLFAPLNAVKTAWRI